jgi:hypothetical protein
LPEGGYEDIELPHLEDHLMAVVTITAFHETRLNESAEQAAEQAAFSCHSHQGPVYSDEEESDDDSTDWEEEPTGNKGTVLERMPHPVEQIALKMSEMRYFLTNVYWCPPVYMSAMCFANTQCYCPCSKKMWPWRELFSIKKPDTEAVSQYCCPKGHQEVIYGQSYQECSDAAFADSYALFQHCCQMGWQGCTYHQMMGEYLYFLFPKHKKLRRSSRERGKFAP